MFWHDACRISPKLIPFAIWLSIWTIYVMTKNVFKRHKDFSHKNIAKKKDKKLSDKEKRQANSCVQTFGVNPLDLSE